MSELWLCFGRFKQRLLRIDTHSRWNNTEIPKVIGYREPTEEDIALSRAHMEKVLIKKGLLKEGEHLTEEEWKKYEI